MALYARYSSDLQNDRSIEHQVQSCTEFAAAKGWNIVNCYSDAGVSGASLKRPGIQALLKDSLNGQFDVVVAEALDRLSRDQEGIAGLYKRLEFTDVGIVTLSEGDISALHIGLKGTMNAMYLRDLADKTRRGLRGKVKEGKSGGGLSYGYRVVKQFTAQGEAIRGDRSIYEAQALIVRRIFHEYANLNRSPKTIAHRLNQDGIAGPSGKSWGPTTINGNRKRGTGILNNELYIGQLVWNRQRFVKDPSTGRRVPRYNPQTEWIRREVSELRIVPQDLWDAAKDRQKSLEKFSGTPHKCNRPRYLLSGLIRCGVCGGGYSKISKMHYGCSTSRNKGLSVCVNRKTIRRDTLEQAVLGALKAPLMHDALADRFSDEYARRFDELRCDDTTTLGSYKAEKDKLAKERRNILAAIRNGISVSLIKDELERITFRLNELDELLIRESTHALPHRRTLSTKRYLTVIDTLAETLNCENTRAEFSGHLARLIDRIVLTPAKEHEDLQITLHGALASNFSVSGEKTE